MRSSGSVITLFARNFMWLASAATASTCCSVDCSSLQNVSAACSRRSAGIRFQMRVGRNALRSDSMAPIVTVPDVPERLFTPRFFVMCGFSFTVFLSAFQLLPTAPFHILDLGGSTFASGLFLGFLTYSSAFSAPLTGAYADRVGSRRVLIWSQPGARRVLGRSTRSITERAAAAGARAGARRVLVGAALGERGLHDQPAAGEPSCGGHRLLGAVDARGDRGGADRRVLDLQPRLDLAVRARRGPEPRHGDHRHASRGAAACRAGCRRPRREGGCSSGACSSSRSRCCSTRSATAASPASPRSTPTPTASSPRAST